jgi:hypothetical protein
MRIKRALFLFAVLVTAGGCVPAPRAYRVFLPPQPTAQSRDARLKELQHLFECGLITPEEYTRKREDIPKEP